MNTINQFSKRLSEQLDRQGVSLRELEAKTGISKSTLSRYVTGTIDRVPLGKLELIANALHVSSAYLASFTDDPFYDVPELEVNELQVIFDTLSDEKKAQLIQFARFLAQED